MPNYWLISFQPPIHIMWLSYKNCHWLTWQPFCTRSTSLRDWQNSFQRQSRLQMHSSLDPLKCLPLRKQLAQVVLCYGSRLITKKLRWQSLNDLLLLYFGTRNRWLIKVRTKCCHTASQYAEGKGQPSLELLTLVLLLIFLLLLLLLLLLLASSFPPPSPRSTFSYFYLHVSIPIYSSSPCPYFFLLFQGLFFLLVFLVHLFT